MLCCLTHTGCPVSATGRGGAGRGADSSYPVRWGLDLEQFALKLELFNSEL